MLFWASFGSLPSPILSTHPALPTSFWLLSAVLWNVLFIPHDTRVWWRSINDGSKHCTFKILCSEVNKFLMFPLFFHTSHLSISSPYLLSIMIFMVLFYTWPIMTARPLGTIQELSASLLSPSDFSYDKTDEDLAGNMTFLQNERSCKRPSAPPMEEEDDDITPPGKKHKRSVSRCLLHW